MGSPKLTRTLMAAAGLAAACSAPAGASNGGTFASLPATAKSVTCRTGCASLKAARPGSTIRVLGADMGDVTQVVFLGRRGAGDDVSAAATVIDAGSVDAVVPAGAASGRLLVVNSDGNLSKPTRRRLRIAASPAGGGLSVRVAQRRVLYDGTRKATLDLYAGDAAGQVLSVDLLHEPDGAVVGHWDIGPIPAGTVQSITWDGLMAGRPAPEGRYEFHVTPATGATVRSAQAPPAATSFLYLGHMFPVRGRHTYGDGIGAARSGHVHQGVDILADCGLRVVAARGGVVKYKGRHAAAGNYLVIDGEGTGVDTVYMHLREPSTFEKGDRVLTGQVIGYVGRTGDASACHLHFEEWSAPGWYTGGDFMDPLPDLKAWDALT